MNRTIKDFVIEATCWSAALFFLGGGCLVHLPDLPSEAETRYYQGVEVTRRGIRN